VNTRFAEDDTPERATKRRRVSAHANRPTVRVTPTQFDQLNYNFIGHFEGYVLYWNERATSFGMVARASGPSGGILTGLDDDHAAARHAINLVFDGREITGYIKVKGVQRTHYQLKAPGFDPANPGLTPWAQLDFAKRREGSGRWYSVRRPAYCTLRVANQANPSDTYLPVVVFHAPSSEGAGAFAGTDRCGMSRQLYQAQDRNDQWTTANRTVVGGDFNVSTQHEYEYVYRTFTAPLGAADNRGAGCTQFVPSRTGTADADLSKSIVRVTKPDPQGGGYRNLIQILPPQGHIDSNDLYRSLAVDNIFTRGFSAADPPKTDYQVYNLPAELQINQSAAATLAKAALHQFIKNETKDLARDPQGNPVWYGTAPFYRNILDYPQLMAQLKARHFTSPRRTAEFTNTFLSDHMPLIVKVTT
jgi:hypothetical protein